MSKYLQLLPCNNPKNREGSLLRLFQSELFSLEMLILYLNKKFNEVGVRDFLINKLCILSDEEVDFYLAEICHIVIKRESLELERFLIDRCIKNYALCFKISWLISSFGESNRKDKKKYEKIERILKLCEFSMMNGSFFQEDSFRVRPNFLIKDPLKFERDIFEKEHKQIYNEYIKKLIESMTKLSLTLKSIIPEERKSKLLESIRKFNGVIDRKRKKYRAIDKNKNLQIEFLNIFHGILIPFSKNNDWPFNSNLIVSIIESDFIPFNTKKRVPYKISVETIDVNDLMFCHLKIDDLENETALTEYDLDDFHETLVTNSISSTDDIAKINKYQGLDHFVKKIMDQEEKKKNKEDIETLNSPDWKNKLPKNFQMLLNLFGEKPKNDNNFNNLNSFNNTIEKNNDLPLSTTLIDFKGKTEFEKNRRQFNKLFPMKKLKKTQSMPKLTLKIFSDEDETTPLPCANYRLTMMRPNQIFSNIEKMVDSISFEKEKEIKPKKITRELSFKNLAIKERLDFLENLRKGSIESPKEHILDHIRKKIESEIAKDDISSEHLVFSDMKGPWGEPWDRKVAEFQKNSAFGHFPSYQIKNIIIKGGDDLRQELIAMQIIIKFKQIFEEAGLKLYLRPYEIMVTSPNSGILEFIPNTLSIDGLKKILKDTKNIINLSEIYEEVFAFEFEEAQKNFIESLAGYSLVCYLLQIKDRHNGNILIDSQGHIIHIDFGFILSLSPGGINFESSPFKMTTEYVELLGGKQSETFSYFKILLVQGFMELRKHVDSIVYIIEIMMEDSDLPCFQEFDLKIFRSRFFEKSTDKECFEFVENLINMSCDNWRTVQYDNFQKMTNGIMN